MPEWAEPCNGEYRCKAAEHVHGCYAERGSSTLRQAVIEVTYDPHDRSDVDGDGWAYTLRMGGIDAESVLTRSDVALLEGGMDDDATRRSLDVARDALAMARRNPDGFTEMSNVALAAFAEAYLEAHVLKLENKQLRADRG